MAERVEVRVLENLGYDIEKKKRNETILIVVLLILAIFIQLYNVLLYRAESFAEMIGYFEAGFVLPAIVSYIIYRFMKKKTKFMLIFSVICFLWCFIGLSGNIRNFEPYPDMTNVEIGNISILYPDDWVVVNEQELSFIEVSDDSGTLGYTIRVIEDVAKNYEDVSRDIQEHYSLLIGVTEATEMRDNYSIEYPTKCFDLKYSIEGKDIHSVVYIVSYKEDVYFIAPWRVPEITKKAYLSDFLDKLNFN